MAKIELRGVSKQFGDVVAVDDVDAAFAEGSYTMILGPSGSGKSTLLRIVAGLESPTEGDVLVDGERVTDVPPQHRNLSMVFQNLALWDHKTVRENMAFGLKMAGVAASERRERVEEIAEILQIGDKLDDNPTTLSGGQQQRVALGRSLVRHPEVVLLDEPLGSLDERLRLRMRTELKRIQRETGTTFVHVTHNQEDAMTVADEILLIDAGRRQQFGDPLELYEEPTNEFVARFIGSPTINLFDADVRSRDGHASVAVGDVELRLKDRAESLLEFDREDVRLGIRPEDLRVVDGSTVGRTVEARVQLVETFGDFNWYYLESPLGELVMQSADDRVVDSVGQGDRIEVAIDPAAVHLFDGRTGDAIR